VSRRYENPPQPEQVEADDGHPLAELAILVGGVVAIGVALVAIVAFGATWLAPKIPFRLEQQLAQRFFKERESRADEPAASRERALRGIADRVVREIDLPRGVSVIVHYDDSPVLNAFATLGGHIVVCRGLIERMPNEDALAAVIAHEVAHIRRRHPASSLGRGVALALVLSVIGSSASGLADRLIGTAPNLTLLKFSREQETEADGDALRAVGRVYGHVGGVLDLFQMFRDARPDASRGVQFLLTHPITAERLQYAASAAEREGWSTRGARTPIPEVLKPGAEDGKANRIQRFQQKPGD
jgi:predicted Zn-dependent protease